MISVIQDNDVYIIRFPYDEKLKDIVKDVPGRRWIPEQKIWTIPTEHIGWFMQSIKDTIYEDDITIKSYEDINVGGKHR